MSKGFISIPLIIVIAIGSVTMGGMAYIKFKQISKIQETPKLELGDLANSLVDLEAPTILISPEYFYPTEDILYIEGTSKEGAIVDIVLEKQAGSVSNFIVKADLLGRWVMAEKLILPLGDWQIKARQKAGN